MKNITIKELTEFKKANMDMDKIILKKDCINAKYSYILKESDVLGSYVHCSIKDFDYQKEYLFLGEDNCAVLVPMLRCDYDIKYDFNNIIVIDSDCLDKCDNCGKLAIKDILININPENTSELKDLNESFTDFDGFLCSDCYESNLTDEYKNKINK